MHLWEKELGNIDAQIGKETGEVGRPYHGIRYLGHKGVLQAHGKKQKAYDQIGRPAFDDAPEEADRRQDQAFDYSGYDKDVQLPVLPVPLDQKTR